MKRALTNSKNCKNLIVLSNSKHRKIESLNQKRSELGRFSK